MVKSRPLSVVLPPVQVPICVRVKKAIDDILAQLMVEKNDEIKHKGFCVEEFNTNQVQTERKNTEQQDLLAWGNNVQFTNCIDGMLLQS